MQENRISIQISPVELQQIMNALDTVNSILRARLITLSVDERKALPKMNDGSLPFVQKALDYCKSSPEFVPVYVAVPELQIDVNAVRDLLQVHHPLEQLCQAVDDTIMLAGSEAYVAALGYYNNVKQATKMKIPKAEQVFEDLSARFSKLGKKAPDTAPNRA